jgi:diguanylate cyclase (GGDEF)-like protein/PAS domain S-box-containing protein
MARMKSAATPAAKARDVLILGFGMLILTVIVLTVLDFARLQQARDRMDRIVGRHSVSIEAISAVLSSDVARAEALHALLNAISSTQREDAERAYQAANDRLDRAIADLQANRLGAEEEPALRGTVEIAGRTRTIDDEVAALVLAGHVREAQQMHRERAVRLEEQFVEKVNALLSLYRSRTIDAVRRAETEIGESIAVTFGLRVGAVVVGLIVAYFVIRYIAVISEALHREKERAEVALYSIGDGVITVGAGGCVDSLNPMAEKLTGWTREEAFGLPLKQVYAIVNEETREAVEYEFAEEGFSRKGGGAAAGIRLVHREGREFPIEDTVSPMRDGQGTVIGRIVVFHDVTHLRTMARQLTWQASHDPLTGLVNRREFERRLAESLETAHTQEKRHALLYVDLDKFKTVNDQCGHVAGDDLLRQLASAMQARIRGSDTLGRLGGDEFGVLLEACPLDQAIRIANGLCETVRDFRFQWKDATYGVGVSVGLVPLDAEVRSVEEVMEAADASCYAAKSRGGNRIQIHHPAEADLASHHRDVTIVSRIDKAFEHGNFRLFRQPIVPVSGHARPHYEVLVRMVDALGLLIPPTEFMPTAERYSLLPILDRWVITTMVDYLAHHTKRAKHVHDESTFYAINLSGASINDSTFAEFLRRLLAEQHVPSERLCFEITETTAIANLTKAAELMHELKTFGCRFALDDFGIGVSSFAYLKYLPVDYLKIDGTFIRDLAHNPMDHAIVEAINRIGHVLGMRTVAECVEDAATLERLRELKVDFAQGTAVGEPEAMEVRARPRAAVVS